MYLFFNLEIIIKNHVLELQNIELEINLQIQEKMIADMKTIISSQRGILLENNICIEPDEELMLDDDLEIDLDDLND
jgi:hypothetical protein